MKSLIQPRIVVAAIVAVLVAGVVAWSMVASGGMVPSVAAQEGEPGARIQPGSCEELSLDDALVQVSATPESDPDDDSALYSFEMDIAVSLDDLISDPHMVALDLNSGDVISTIACGDVDGVVRDGRLVVDLNSVESEALVGFALLTETDQDQTHAELFVSIGAGDGSAGSDDAPVSDDVVDGADQGGDDGDIAIPENDV